MVSEREIKRRIRRFLPDSEISKEGLVKLKGEIEKEIDMVISDAVQRFKELNKLREIQKLPQLKRFIHGRFKYFETAESGGEIGQTNKDTISSKVDVEVV